MKTLLTVLMAATLISSIQTASACLPEIDGWMYRTHRAELSAEGGDAILVLRGHTSGHFNLEQLDDSVTVTVSREGVMIPGTLEMSVIHDTLIWRAEALVDSDVEYAVTVTTNNGWWSDQQRQDQELKAVWPNEMEADQVGELKSLDTGTYIHKVRGDCLPEGWMDSCGGCEREVLETETHWDVEVGVKLDRANHQFIAGRIALGATPEAAREGLDAAAFRGLAIQDAAYLKTRGGSRDDWDGNTACAAIEIVKFNGATLLRA